MFAVILVGAEEVQSAHKLGCHLKVLPGILPGRLCKATNQMVRDLQ